MAIVKDCEAGTMDFLQQLESHRGGLLRLKTSLYWFSRVGYDNLPDQLGILLDAANRRIDEQHNDIEARSVGSYASGTQIFSVCLLLGSAPHRIWVAQEDVEFL